MKYPTGAGGLTPREQEARERVRLETAERFARGDGTREIAGDLRVCERVARRWRQVWRTGGVEALRSKGSASQERLSPERWDRLEAELKRGPLAHGYVDDQRWTLGRIKALNGRFHVSYTVQGVWKLMRRHGWTSQVPLRQAVERDEEDMAMWKEEVREQVKSLRRTWVPTSASRTGQE
jgi:putative transposase